MGLMKLVVSLGIDATQYNAGLKKAESATKSFAAAAGPMLAGVFSVAAVIAWTRAVVNAADEIGDLAEQFEITTDQVQALQAAAAKTGVPFEQLASAMQRVKKLQIEARAGDEKAKGLLGAAGIGINDPAFEAMQKLGESGGVEKLAAQVEILGTKLLKVRNALGEIKELGTVQLVSEKDAELLSKFSDDLDALGRTAKGLWANLLGVVYGGANALGNAPYAKGIFERIGQKFGMNAPGEITVPTNRRIEPWEIAALRAAGSLPLTQPGSSAGTSAWMGGEVLGTSQATSDLLEQQKRQADDINKILEAIKNATYIAPPP
jgi:hypothetical protein